MWGRVGMYRAFRFWRIEVLALALLCAGMGGCVASEAGRKTEAPPFDQDLIWLSYHFNVRVDGRALILRSGVGTYTDTIEGDVTGADVGDLNRDGFPEVLVYLSSSDSNRYGSVVGYSSNRGKSMSLLYAPLATKEAKYAPGYHGHDEFAIVEDTLIQRFPISPEERITSESGPTMRQIQYRLVDGEAGRKLVVSKVVEY